MRGGRVRWLDPLRRAAVCTLVCTGAASAAPYDNVASLNAADAKQAANPAAIVAGPESPLSTGYLKLIWADAQETVTEPLHWDGNQWRTATLVGGGLLLSMAVLDKPIRDFAQRN